MTRTNEKAAVPRLRFKGCEGEWEDLELSEYFTLRNESNESGAVKEILSVLKDVGVILYSDKGNIGNRAKDDVTHYKIAHKGDIVLNSMNVLIGSVGVSRYDGCISPVYYALAPKMNCCPEYFGYWFWRKETQKLLVAQACGMMEIRRKISERDLLAISRPTPPLPEQKFIGNCLLSIDHLLKSSSSRLASLRQLKRAMLVKMFPRPGQCVPEIRFKEFDGKWEEMRVRDVAERVTRKNVNRESDLPLTISAEHGLIDQKEVFNNRIAAKDVSNYYLVVNGEFAYNRSTSDGAPFGAVKRLDRYPKGVLSTLYMVFALKGATVDSDYLVQYYATDLWHRDIALRAAEGARNHGLLNISVEDFFDTRIIVPSSLPEQRKIAAFFRNLDRLIWAAEKKATKLRQVKASLLERMFA